MTVGDQFRAQKKTSQPDSVPKQLNKSKNKNRLAGSALAALLLIILAQPYLRVPDLKVFELFIPSVQQLGREDASLSNADTGIIFLLANSSLLIMASIIGAWIGYKKKPVACLVLFLQSNVLLVFISCLLMNFCNVPGMPVSTAITIATAMLLGNRRRAERLSQSRMEAKEIELKLRNRELEESRLLLVKQDETDRRLLAADLHDQILNDLKAVNREIDKGEELDSKKLRSAINDVMTEIRVIMDNLSPYVLEHFGLGAALEDILQKGSNKADFDYRFRSKVETADLERFSLVEKQLLYRLIQESLTNIVKHAQAKKVTITITRDIDQIVFTVEDDGKGFVVEDMDQNSRGLTYMKLRASLIGAQINWQSKPGEGTRAIIRIAERVSE